MSLGKGLGALITPTSGGSRKKITLATGDSANRPERIWSVPVHEIHPDPAQPRKHFDDGELRELAQSIKEHGVLQPLLVAEEDSGGYTLIAGERRWRAAQLTGLANVPVIVKELPDRAKVEVALIENIQRADLNPIEEAFAYKRLIEEFGLTQEQVAEKVGKSRPAIANAVRLLELPTEVQQALVEKKISAGQGRALLSLSSTVDQLEMLASMQGSKITVRELERTAQHKRPSTGRRDANITFLEDQLRLALGTKASIRKRGGQGTIVLSFYSEEELRDVIKKITGT